MKCHGILSFLLALVSGLFLLTTAHAKTLDSPVGYWKTIDDISGRPKSIVKIWESDNHILMGQVVKLFRNPGKSKEVCAACNGDKHNQPIVGMVILSGLQANDHQWSNGKILDPHNGKTYSCNARLKENGKKLAVRGYIGMPLLGRSQTWERVDLMSDKG